MMDEETAQKTVERLTGGENKKDPDKHTKKRVRKGRQAEGK